MTYVWKTFTFFESGCELLSVVYIFECELGKPDADNVMDGRLPEASVRPEVGRNSLAQASHQIESEATQSLN